VDYLEFLRWFRQQKGALKFPKDCTELLSPDTHPTSSLVWTIEWILKFTDDTYLRIWEHHTRQAGIIDSRRLGFSYHYGPLTGVNANGIPIYKRSDPVEIRVDNSLNSGEVHLHFGAPDPHYFQDSVDGLILNDLGMFTFIKAIWKHRAKGQELQKLLGFRIK